MTDRRAMFGAAAIALFFAGLLLALAFQQREAIVALALGHSQFSWWQEL